MAKATGRKAHELTHFIKDWSSVKYRALADALVKQYQKQGVSVSELVDNQIAKAKQNGRELSRQEAFDEVVADSMESMLADENAAAFLEKLAQRDKGLKEKVVSWMKELAAKLKNALTAYKDVKPDSPDGKMVAEMEEFRKEIMGIYTSALVDAGGNFRENGGNKNTTRDGGVKYSLNENAAVELHRALYDKSFNGEVLLRDVTPPIIVSQKGVRNLPMSMNASHIRENVFTEQEAKKMGLRTGKGINYHGLGEKFFLKIIDGLDSVKEAYRGTKNASKQERSENYFLLISTFTDKNGDIINVPVYINEHGNVNNVFLDVNKISTVFGRKNLREYIKRQVTNGDLVRIKNRSNQASESNAPIARDYGETASTRIIRNEEPVVNNESQEIFSDRDPTAEATRAALEKENGKLREDVSRLRELLRLQGKVTGGTVPKQSSVEAAAKYLNKYAGAKADVKELSRMLTEFYRFLATEKEYSWEDVHERAMVIARHLQDNVQIKSQISDYARDVLREVRGSKITLDESQRAEVEKLYGSYEAFRKAAFWTVTFVKEGGIPLDSQWQEWSTMFPGTFDSEITASDQPRALMDAINALRNSDTTVMEYAYNRERN